MSDANYEKDEQQLITRLREVVTEYLNEYVLKPSMETVEADIFVQARLANLVFLVNRTVHLVWEDGLNFDKEHLKSLSQEEIRERIAVLNGLINSNENDEFIKQNITDFFSESSSKKFLLPYIQREINWIAISILSASYISSMVLMRAIFMLLICMATRHPEEAGMGNRIDEIVFLDEVEKKKLKKLWKRLNGWAHPYGKWLKNVCPIFVAQKPLHHSELCGMCIQEITEIADFFLTIAITKYEINTKNFEPLTTEQNVDLSDFQSFASRIY